MDLKYFLLINGSSLPTDREIKQVSDYSLELKKSYGVESEQYLNFRKSLLKLLVKVKRTNEAWDVFREIDTLFHKLNKFDAELRFIAFDLCLETNNPTCLRKSLNDYSKEVIAFYSKNLSSIGLVSDNLLLKLHSYQNTITNICLSNISGDSSLIDYTFNALTFFQNLWQC